MGKSAPCGSNLHKNRPKFNEKGKNDKSIEEKKKTAVRLNFGAFWRFRFVRWFVMVMDKKKTPKKWGLVLFVALNVEYKEKYNCC